MAYRRIHSKGAYRYEEANAGGTVTPGMLVELNPAGAYIAHAEEGGRCERAFAQEDALQGKAVGDNYASGSLMGVILPSVGSEVVALIKTGEAGAIDDEVVSAGDGTLRRWGVGGSGVTEWQVVGRLMEAFTTLGANTLKRIRIV